MRYCRERQYSSLNCLQPKVSLVLVTADALTIFSCIRREEHHKGKSTIPETKTGEEGSSKRNIQRKNDHEPHRKNKPQHGGGGGKGKWNDLDDGSMP